MTTTTERGGGDATRGGDDGPASGRRLKIPPWHPILLAAWSVVAVWGGNVHEVAPGDALWVLATVVGTTAGAWALVATVLALWGRARWLARSAIAVSLGALAVLMAGRVAPGIVPAVGLAVVAGLVVVGVAVATTLPDRWVKPVTTLANVFSLVAIVLAAVPIGMSLASTDSPATPARAGDAGQAQDAEATASPERDIFYIIPDRYPRADTAAGVYDFDNSPFQDHLVDRGFTIQDRARANYPKTAHSLAATWNLDYVQELVPEPPEDPADWGPLYRLLDDHRLGRLVTEAGMDYVHIGSWWSPTATSSVATQVFDPDVASEFQAVWSSTTALRWVGAEEAEGGFDSRRSKYELARAQLDELDRLARVPAETPRLVIAHITVPHEPYVFDADGSFVDSATAASRTREENTVNQIKWLNSRLVSLVDTLVAGDEATDPIVVIQSDEGPHPTGVLRQEDWQDIGLAGRKEKLRTFSAWYLPGVQASPPEDITGVNTWRFILDRYTDANFGLLDDRVFVYPTNANLYEFVEVTDDFD